MEPNFNEIQQEILRRAKEASACRREYGRAYVAENLSELSEAIKDNFDWVCAYGVLTVDLIEKYKEDFAANGIYVNQDAESGYILCSNATVEAYNNATVEARDNATVKACENTTVKACENTKVEAYTNATVLACDSTEVEAHDDATVRAYGNTTVEAFDDAMVKAYENATVEAYDNSYCTSYFTIDCKLFDHAIYRVRGANTVYYADSDLKFAKQ